MKSFYACLCVGLFWPFGAGAQEPTVLFEEAFDGSLKPGWTWLREEPAWWCIRDGGLEIRNRPGNASTVINALVRQAPDRRQGSFAVEVTVRNHKVPTEQYEQAGITWYNDGKPVFKLVKELVDGQLMIIPSRKSMTRETVQLRLVVDGNRYTAQFRPDGEGQFQTAAAGELPEPANDRVSLQCYHGPAEGDHWIRFDDFRIVQLTDRPDRPQ
jgi:hypothetical protein